MNQRTVASVWVENLVDQDYLLDRLESARHTLPLSTDWGELQPLLRSALTHLRQAPLRLQVTVRCDDGHVVRAGIDHPRPLGVRAACEHLDRVADAEGLVVPSGGWESKMTVQSYLPFGYVPKPAVAQDTVDVETLCRGLCDVHRGSRESGAIAAPYAIGAQGSVTALQVMLACLPYRLRGPLRAPCTSGIPMAVDDAARVCLVVPVWAADPFARRGPVIADLLVDRPDETTHTAWSVLSAAQLMQVADGDPARAREALALAEACGVPDAALVRRGLPRPDPPPVPRPRNAAEMRRRLTDRVPS